MKNLHLLPTDKPSILGYLTKKGKEVFKDLVLFKKPITPQEKPKIPVSIKELITEISIKELLMEIREWEKQWGLNPNSNFLKNMDVFADELGKKYTVTKK